MAKKISGEWLPSEMRFLICLAVSPITTIWPNRTIASPIRLSALGEFNSPRLHQKHGRAFNRLVYYTNFRPFFCRSDLKYRSERWLRPDCYD